MEPVADGTSPVSDSGSQGGMSRRDLILRGAGALGVVAVLPALMSACEPVPGNAPPELPPDPSLRSQGFVGGVEGLGPVGGWCWFQAPRASIGPNGRLWLGTSVSKTGTAADGDVRVSAYDLGPMAIVDERTVAHTREDDHTSPSVLAFGSKVQVAWALHQRNDFLDIATYQVGAPFQANRIYRPGAITGQGRGMAYASAHLVNGERWILYRGEEFSWNLLTSSDGRAWKAHGLVVKPSSPGSRPYIGATSDGKRLHIVVTDGHPDEVRANSIHAGSISQDLTIRNSANAVIGKVGATAPTPERYTLLLAGKRGLTEDSDTDYWVSDMKFIDNGATALFSERDPWPDSDDHVGPHRHRYMWARKRSSGWTVEPLCWAGGELKLFTQPDYTGLAAQDPTNAGRVVVSTNVHPITAEPLVSSSDGEVHWELFEGNRSSSATWSFMPLTENSTEDNIRPTIAAGGKHKALAWMRGNYWSWTDFDTQIVVRRSAAAG